MWSKLSLPNRCLHNFKIPKNLDLGARGFNEYCHILWFDPVPDLYVWVVYVIYYMFIVNKNVIVNSVQTFEIDIVDLHKYLIKTLDIWCLYCYIVCNHDKVCILMYKLFVVIWDFCS